MELSGVIPNTWFEIIPDSAIVIDADQPVWVGYEIYQPAGEYPASVDSSPAMVGYGDLVFVDNVWLPLSSYGMSNNWSIRAYTTGSGEQLSINIPNEASIKSGNAQQSLNPPLSYNPDPYLPESLNDLQGFNVYVDGAKVNDSPITVTSYISSGFATRSFNRGICTSKTVCKFR